MGRITGFISKAGDIAQQVNENYRGRAETQQPQQQPQQQSQQYAQQQPQQAPYMPLPSPQPPYHPQRASYIPPPSPQPPHQPQRASYIPPPSPQPPTQSQPRPPYYGYEQQAQQVQQQYKRAQDEAAAMMKQYEEQMQSRRLETERLQREHEAQMALAHQETERLQQEYDAQVQRAIQESERMQREVDQQMELAKREAERHEAQARADRERRDAEEALARQAQRDRQQAEEQLKAQMESDRREAERLAAQYQAEYEEELQAATREVDRLRLQESEMRQSAHAEVGRLHAAAAAPPVPPRPQSGVFMMPPPPPPRPTSWAPGAYQAPPPPPPPPATVSPSASYAPSASTVGSTAGPGGNPSYSPAVERQPTQPPPTQQMYFSPPPPPASASVSTPDAVSPSTPYTPASMTVSAPSPDGYPPYTPTGQTQSSQPAQQTYFAPRPPPPAPAPEIRTERPGLPPRASDPAPPVAAAYPSAPPPPPSAGTWPRSKTPPPHPCGITPTTECVDSPVTFGLEWFTHPAAPNFTICTRCYVDHIYNSAFRDSFSSWYVDDNQPRRCLFGTSRMRDGLWPAALNARSLGKAVEFMERRQKISHCKDLSQVKDQYWYTTPEVPGLAICEACYEDEIMSNPSFGGHFKLEKCAQANCDLAVYYIKRMFATQSKANNWATFATEAKGRLNVPNCPKMEIVRTKTRVWFVSKRAPKGLQICAACYCDYFLDTPNAEYMERVELKPSPTDKARCPMGYFNILIPAQESVNKKNWPLFWRAIEGVDNHQLCEASGTKGTTWFTIPNDPAEFAVCGGCVAGIVEPLDGKRHFSPKPGTSTSDLRVCCFNLAHPRALPLITRFAESIYKGTWRPLGDYAAVFAGVPICPRHNMQKGQNKRYWGWEDVQICEECYITFAKGKSIESQFDLRGQVVTQSTICDMYSPRMRNLFLEACASHDATALRTFGTHRRQIFIQTVPICERLLQQEKMAAMQAQTMGVMGTTYTAMGGAQDAVMGHSYTLGNAFLGYGYANSFMLQGAAYSAQSVQLSAQVSDPGMIMQVKTLEERWRAVE